MSNKTIKKFIINKHHLKKKILASSTIDDNDDKLENFTILDIRKHNSNSSAQFISSSNSSLKNISNKTPYIVRIHSGLLIYNYNLELKNGHILVGNQRRNNAYALYGFGGHCESFDNFPIITAFREIIEELFNIPDDFQSSKYMGDLITLIKKIIIKLKNKSIILNPIITVNGIDHGKKFKYLYLNYPINFAAFNFILNELKIELPIIIKNYNKWIDETNSKLKKIVKLYNTMPTNINELIYNRKIEYSISEVFELGIIPISQSSPQIHKYIIDDIKLLKQRIKYYNKF